MKNILLTLMISLLILFVACKEGSKETKSDETVKTEETETKKEEKTLTKTEGEVNNYVSVRLESKSNSGAQGKLYFKEENGTVTLEAKFLNLDPGTHAVHIHESADCSSPDGKSAGGHWNPTFESHGKWGNENGYHKGDIGNIEVDEQGFARLTMETDEWCIGCGDEKKDILGKSIIVHQGADDFVSQPSGAAGARISCGGIIK